MLEASFIVESGLSGLWASVVAAHGLSSCGTWAVAQGMWHLPTPGIKPVSPPLTGRFLSTVPPGKSNNSHFYIHQDQFLVLT